MHDGYVYNFPLADDSYAADDAYDIWLDADEVSFDSVSGGSVNLAYELPNAASDSDLVPQFRHPAQPIIPTVRALDQARAKTLDKWARWMNAHWYADATPVGDNAEELADLLVDSAIGGIAKIVPTNPVNIARTVGLQFAPLVGAATFGPPGFVVGLAVSESVALALQVKSLNNYANEYQQEFEESGPEDAVTIGIGDQISSIYQTESNSSSASVQAVLSAIRAQAHYGSQSLATASDFQASIEGTRQLLEDQLEQLETFRDTLMDIETEIRVNSATDGDNFDRQENILQGVIDFTRTELDLLDSLESTAENRINGFREDWNADSLDATANPNWDSRTVSSAFQAEVTESVLRVAANGGEGTVRTSDPVSFVDGSWNLNGVFWFVDASGEFEHSIRITDGETEHFSLSVIRTDRTIFRLSSSVIGDQTREITLDPRGRYGFAIEHSGDGSYHVELVRLDTESTEPTELFAITETGTPLSSRENDIEYYTATAGETTVVHEYLEYRIMGERLCGGEVPETPVAV